MATTKGTAIAAPQIFGSDPLEQGFAKGLTDPDMGGLSYAFFNAARGDRARNQSTYLEALRESNMMAARLAAHEADQELLGKYLTSSAEMANAGIDPSTMPISAKLYRDPMDPLVRQPSALSRDVKLTQAEKNRADAAQARSGGAGGGVQFQVDQDYGPGGSAGNRKETFKGKDPAAVAAAAEARARANAAPGTGTVIRGDGTVGPPTTADARAAGTPGSTVGVGSDARARAEAQRTQKKLEQVK